jgi:chorismate mutase
VRLRDLDADAVVVARRDRHADVVTEHGFVRTVHVGDTVEPITDPARESQVLRRALRTAHAQAEADREHLSRAEAEHTGTLDRIRAYAIRKYRSNDICQSGLDAFLEEFSLGAYEPRVRVSFTIVGSYEVGGGDVRDARNDAEGYLAVNLDRLDNVVPDSEDVTVTVDSAEAVDDDD